METRQPPEAPEAGERSEGTGLTTVGPPQLPPFWVEWGRYVSRKWPLPVFALAVVSTAAFLWLRPEIERVRPWEEYVEDAKWAFSEAIEAQDKRGKATAALTFLARENVQELAMARWKEREGAAREQGKGEKPVTKEEFDAAAPLSEGMAAVRGGKKWGFVDRHGKVVIALKFDEVGRFFEGITTVRDGEKRYFIDKSGNRAKVNGYHGVLPSYDRVIEQVGESALRSEDLARIGEAYYRLARIKREDPDGVGRSISMSVEALHWRAAARLEGAEETAQETLKTARDEGRSRQAQRLIADLEGAKWRRRRRMWAECQVHLGKYKEAIEKLKELIDEMNAAAAKRLRIQKDPRTGAGGATRNGGASEVGSSVEEWARVYELLARSYDRRGDHHEAARNYRLFLEQGVGGTLAHRARVRLAELVMDGAISEREAAEARKGFDEVEVLCRKVEESDASAELREDATFLHGRAAYRLGMMAAEADEARAAFIRARGAFRYPYSPSRRYLDMSRVLLARSLFRSGREAEAPEALEALEILDGILRVGSHPAIYACAEVSRADMKAGTEPAEAVGGRVKSKQVTVKLVLGEGKTAAEVLGLKVKELSRDRAAALGLDRGGALAAEVLGDGPAERGGMRQGDVLVRFGRKEITDVADLLEAAKGLKAGTQLNIGVVRPDRDRGLTHGYMDAIRRIRRLPPAERAGLVPELADLLEDAHFVELAPVPGRRPPAGGAQLLHIARAYSTVHQFDEAARIYRHILRAYPKAARDRYGFLLGELYAAKAGRLARSGRKEKEQRRARLAAARAFMQVPLETRNSPLAAGAYWLAGRNYFAARRYDGASRAFDKFTTLFGDDRLVGEGLYLLGESLRRMGDARRAATVFTRCSVEHRDDRFGYLSHLALGETYLEMGKLDAAPGEKGAQSRENARAVFEAIRRDARYTPDSQVWMKAFLRLGETYYRLGRRGLLLAREMELARKDAAVVTAAQKRLAEMKAKKVDKHFVAHEEQWVEKLIEAAEKKKENLAARTVTGAHRNLRLAAEILEEAEGRYPLSKYGKKDRPSFHSFLKGQRLPARRTLAMIRFKLGEYDHAHERFADILKVTGVIGAFERAEADAYRREAYTFKGLIELRQKKYDLAAGTFEKAYDEYSRTADGPWFRFAAGAALEKAGRQQEARAKYAEAIGAYRRLHPGIGKPGAKPAAKGEWVLRAEDWFGHKKWVGDTL